MDPTPSQPGQRDQPDLPAAPILEAQGLSKSFRGLRALEDYQLRLTPGSIHGVIGPNGAGKTTLFHLLSGFLPPTSGTIRFESRDVTGQPAFRISRMGVGRTFQNIRLFGDLSVLENVLIAVQRRSRWSPLGAMLSTPGFLRSERDLQAQAFDLLDLFGLTRLADRTARSLPYGDQRRLEIARAVGARPKVLLLDEPNAGMNPIETQDLLALIRRLRDELGITIILVAHDIPLVMNLCERIQVLNYGKLIAEGDPAAVRSNADVIAAYLGQARDADRDRDPEPALDA